MPVSHAHIPALIFIVGVLIILALWLVPFLQAKYSEGVTPENRFGRENDARKVLAQIIGGIFVLGGIYSSVKTFDLQRQSADLQREGQITDRFSKAIDQLGAVPSSGGADSNGRPKINLEVRLGGIYALERIAIDSPRDQWTIMEVLMTYVRENSLEAATPQTASQRPDAQRPAHAAVAPRLRTDLQAILTVIGRRDVTRDPSNRQLDLSGAQLAGADLKEARLKGTLLINTNLAAADLTDAALPGSDFEDANLEGAFLLSADLKGAVLTRADLKGADLSGADLSGAIVTDAQLGTAIGDADTKLPASAHRPASWSH